MFWLCVLFRGVFTTVVGVLFRGVFTTVVGVLFRGVLFRVCCVGVCCLGVYLQPGWVSTSELFYSSN